MLRYMEQLINVLTSSALSTRARKLLIIHPLPLVIMVHEKGSLRQSCLKGDPGLSHDRGAGSARPA
jgi:hypothetical protein